MMFCLSPCIRRHCIHRKIRWLFAVVAFCCAIGLLAAFPISAQDSILREERFQQLGDSAATQSATAVSADSATPTINFLKTPWSAEVTPAHVHPEYPRPTMTRENWMSLNGLWNWRDTTQPAAVATGVSAATQATILVPFPIESTLSRIGPFIARHSDRFACSRSFQIPENWPKNHRVLLHFGAVDWEAVVLLNGQLIGKHQGGYDSFSFDITDQLRRNGGLNELIVHVFDPTDRGDQPCGKQSILTSGNRYSAVSGIWQTVWLEPVPPEHFRSVQYIADADAATLTILPVIAKPRKNLFIYAEAFDGENTMAEAYGGSDGPLLLRFAPETIKQWSPDNPHLYLIRLRILEENVTIDQIGSYFAFRNVDSVRDDKGQMRIRLNGKILFQLGIIDQGYWPDGLYTAPTDVAIQTDIKVAKSLGFNVIRKHQKIEPERWYYWCDRIGMLVWQDMPGAANRTAESKANFRNELQKMVLQRVNHPCIVVWTIFNEGWGQHQTAEYVDMIHELDPTRLVNAASGWNHTAGLGDLNDHHQFPGPEMPTVDPKRASVLGAFGAFTLVPPEKNRWTSNTWGFQHVSDSKTLLRRYGAQHETLRNMIFDEGLAGAMFHQLSDIEGECNGMASYDRELLKVPPDDFYRINRETIRLGSEPSDKP